MDQTKRILVNLEKQGVTYLEYDAYNEIEHSDKYNKSYATLFNEIIVNRIYKQLGIEPKDPNVIFNFFEKRKDGWYAVFYEPELDVSLKTLVSDPKAATAKLRHELTSYKWQKTAYVRTIPIHDYYAIIFNYSFNNCRNRNFRYRIRDFTVYFQL